MEPYDMAQLQKDINEIKQSIAAIKQVLGIGAVSPMREAELKRRAMAAAEKIRRRESEAVAKKADELNRRAMEHVKRFRKKLSEADANKP